MRTTLSPRTRLVGLGGLALLAVAIFVLVRDEPSRPPPREGSETPMRASVGAGVRLKVPPLGDAPLPLDFGVPSGARSDGR